VKWVTLEENVLRQRVTTDLATKGGQFDVLTIGTLRGADLARRVGSFRSTSRPPATTWPTCCPRSAMPSPSGAALPPAPFSAESSMIMYRTDLFQEAGMTMPEKPTWDFR